jgi:hypothetical protein
MAARSLPSARTGQNGCSLGLPSGRVVARNAIEKLGVPGRAIVIAPAGPRHLVSSVPYNHYSMLRTIEDA